MNHFHSFLAILLCIALCVRADGVSGCGGSIKNTWCGSQFLRNHRVSGEFLRLCSGANRVQSPGILLHPHLRYRRVFADNRREGWLVCFASLIRCNEGSVVGCEDKTVFEITGFHLSGHTHHAASAMATKGIRVSLLSTDNHVLKSVETDENGDYNFENVPSGEYVLKAEHSSWVLA
ncbi:hypothetical protein BLSTO_05959, partial [Blastocystis sp. subtype 1]